MSSIPIDFNSGFRDVEKWVDFVFDAPMSRPCWNMRRGDQVGGGGTCEQDTNLCREAAVGHGNNGVCATLCAVQFSEACSGGGERAWAWKVPRREAWDVLRPTGLAEEDGSESLEALNVIVGLAVWVHLYVWFRVSYVKLAATVATPSDVAKTGQLAVSQNTLHDYDSGQQEIQGRN